MNIKNKLSSIIKDDLILDTIFVFIGTSLAGFFNLLYHLVSVRLLGPEDYGTFNALISIIMFSLMAITPLGTSLVRYFTEYIAKGEFGTLLDVFKKIIKRLVYCAVVVILLFMLFSVSLSDFLNTKQIYIIICAGIIALSLFPLPIVSLLQSFQKFKIYSGIGIISAFGKLIVGSLFMMIGYKIYGGLLGIFIGPMLVLAASLFFIFRITKKELGSVRIDNPLSNCLVPIYKYFFPVSITMFSFTFLTNIDVILVKHFFSPLEAGYYSIAQMVGKITLFLPSALAIVIFPKSTKAFVLKSSSLKILYKSFLMAGICCSLSTLLSFLFPELVLTVLTGKANSVSGSLVGIFALAMSFYALLWITINYLLAIHNLKFILPILLLAIMQTVTIYFCHSKLLDVLYVLLFYSVISFAAGLIVVKTTKNN